MNKIRAIQALNQKELEQGISPSASWHTDYRDTAFIYFGGLPYDLSEGDIITIFSQFGEPDFLKLVRDKETGKSKGFGWLKYEDQRSTDLAVDNLGGAEIAGRIMSVDHARYKPRDDEDPEEFRVGWEAMQRKEGHPVSEDENENERDSPASVRSLLPAERELEEMMRDHDDDDPMKMYLIEEKKKEIEEARAKKDHGKERKHRHRHHRSSKHRRDEDKTRSRRHVDDDSADEQRRRRHHGDLADDKRHRRRDDDSIKERVRRRRRDDSADDRRRRRHDDDKRHTRRD